MKTEKNGTAVVLTDHGVFLDSACKTEEPSLENCEKYEEKKRSGRTKTMAYRILSAHNYSGDMEHLQLKFDALVWRNLCPALPGCIAPVYAGDDGGVRENDSWIRQPYPLRGVRHHGNWRGRRRGG